MTQPFMGVIVACLEATHFHDWLVRQAREDFASIAAGRPDLADRYATAVANRDAGEIERLLEVCRPMLDEQVQAPLSAIRIHGVTQRFHVGHGRSIPLFAG